MVERLQAAAWSGGVTSLDCLKSFLVGSPKLDATNVGFVTTEGSFTFDTTQKGNSNAGHVWGTTLSDADRWALVEYLKSL